ncbi:hypothetical protein [Microvirga makkahensis]|uniref:Moybdenum cofactor oxidoreductase dimerisation domain-containing protein n=1 Tax=Microvirga makkahensis TaxID=1128670 RepID=A0A7X3SNT3_9HYPH|nr:hypothetical protein [Microvirga makkahensis]MXQ11736.1 hypothetical protein [Microvirga makkahensis]
MPVKSIITYPATASTLPRDNRTVEVRGHARAGDRPVSHVDVSTDDGATWTPADPDPAPTPTRGSGGGLA